MASANTRNFVAVIFLVLLMELSRPISVDAGFTNKKFTKQDIDSAFFVPLPDVKPVKVT